MRDLVVLIEASSLAHAKFLLYANQMEVPSGLIKSPWDILVLLVHKDYQ
jgi:hypothetical protein